MAIPESVKEDFNSFRQYLDLGRVALMETQHVATGHTHYLFVLIHENPDRGGQVAVYPLGRLFTSDHEMIADYLPPDTDGGYSHKDVANSCPDCGGSGRFDDIPCTKCNATGVLQ